VKFLLKWRGPICCHGDREARTPTRLTQHVPRQRMCGTWRPLLTETISLTDSGLGE
jgi:hypothetical protein